MILFDEISGLPGDKVLEVPSHPARELDKDLKKAQIPKKTDEEKIDFHAFRAAFVTIVLESGASAKEAQDLARHSTPNLTMNVYARTRKNRLHDTAEKAGEIINKAEKYGTGMAQPENSKKNQIRKSIKNNDLDSGKEEVEAAGVERATTKNVRLHTIPTKSLQFPNITQTLFSILRISDKEAK